MHRDDPIFHRRWMRDLHSTWSLASLWGPARVRKIIVDGVRAGQTVSYGLSQMIINLPLDSFLPSRLVLEKSCEDCSLWGALFLIRYSGQAIFHRVWTQ